MTTNSKRAVPQSSESERQSHRPVQFADPADESGDDLWEQWQQRWTEQRHRIAERLSVIDAQLRAMSADPHGRPELTVVGVPPVDQHETLD